TELERDAFADAPTGTGDDGDLAVEWLAHAPPSHRSTRRPTSSMPTAASSRPRATVTPSGQSPATGSGGAHAAPKDVQAECMRLESASARASSAPANARHVSRSSVPNVKGRSSA